jgi:hypothetical protein
MMKITNYTNIDFNEYNYSLVPSSTIITKSGVGLEVITAEEIKKEIKNAKNYCSKNPTEVL